MSEQTTLEVIAPTVEEAIAQGLEQLGQTADAVSIEVVDSGSKGLFGLGGRQVRVRLTVNPPPAPVIIPPAKPERPAQEKPVKKAKEPAPQKPKEPRAAQEPKEAKEKPARQPKAQPVVAEAEIPSAPKMQRVEVDRVLDTTEAVVSKLVHQLGMKAQVTAQYDDSSTDDRRVIQVDVQGKDLSALIGKRAETLNAFQYVASLIVGKQTQQWIQLSVDVEGYRSRREKQVKQVALRMVEQVIRTGKKAVLEPMTSGERRAIHIELRNHPAVTTESTGDEPNRKVVILPRK